MVKGLAEHRRRFRRVMPAVRKELVRVLEREAGKIVREMKSIAPTLQKPDKRRRIGALRGSIGWTWGDAPAGSIAILQSPRGGQYGKIFITIYAGSRGTEEDAFYAHFLEFGTVKMAAQPYFFPVFRANRARVRGNLTRAVNRGMRQAARR